MLHAAANNLGKEGVAFFKEVAKDAWDGFTTEEKFQMQSLLMLMASARLLELTGEDIGDTIEILEAAFLQWKVAGKTVIVSAFKQTAREVFGLGGEFLGGLLRSALAGI